MTGSAGLFWRRKRTWICLLGCLLPIATIFLATRSFVLSPLLRNMLQETYSGQFEVGTVRWQWSGRISVDSIILKTDETSSAASDVITVNSASINFSSPIPIFNREIQSIEIGKVILRLAESTEHMGEYNFSHLFPKEGPSAEEDKIERDTTARKVQPLPDIDLKALIVETGRMNNQEWIHESTRHFSVDRVPSDRWDYLFHLLDEEDELKVQVGVSTSEPELQVNVENVQLNESIIKQLPKTARIWCKETEFRGNVKELLVSWNPIEGIEIVTTVEDINFLLPEQYSPPWAHYNDGKISRMRGKASLDVETGQIVFDGSSVSFRDIHGSLSPPEHKNESPIPFSGEIEISGLSSAIDPESGEWMKGLVANAPFRARFVIETDEPPKEASGAVELPLVVAQVLKIFQLEEWKVNAQVDVERVVFGGTVDVSGELQIDGKSGMYEGFPYPLRGIQSLIKFHQDDIESVYEDGLGSGEAKVYMSFEGVGGGIGEMVGSILFLDHGVVVPDIHLTIKNEDITPALTEAISLVAGDSYDVVLGVLNGMGLESDLSLTGTILGNDQGKVDTFFKVRIEDGVATPNANLSTAIHTNGPFWPDGFQFTDVDGVITIENGAVEMNGATFTCDTGSLEATMSVKDGEFELKLNGSGLPLSSRFVEVLPNNVSSKLTSAWHWFEPGGLMDVNIVIGHNNGVSTLHMEMIPRLVTVTGNGETVDLEHVRGSVVVDGSHVVLNDLDFQLQSNGAPQGFLQIKGDVLGSKEDFHFDIGATWQAAAIGSPLTRAIWGIVGGQPGVEYFDSLEPTGHASAILAASGNRENIIYDIEIIPSILSTTFNNRRAVAVFDQDKDGKSNTIHFDNSGIQFQQLVGKLGDGVFFLDGSIDTTSGIDGEFDLTWNGPSGDKSLFAVLPSVVGDTLEAIDLRAGTSDLPDGKVLFEGEDWSGLGVSFTGSISLSDVSISIGIPLTKIMGMTIVDGRYNKEHLSELKFVLKIDSMSALGRHVSDIDGRLRLDSDLQRIVFEKMRGESTTGSVSVDGWLAVDETKQYEIEILIAGVDLKTDTGDDAFASLEGELTGWLSMAGVRGDASTRRGLGLIRVQHGHFSADPLSLTAMQVLQLALPSTSSITGAYIELFIDGDRMVLENITLTSDSGVSDLVLEGDGTIDTETFTLKARLHPRAGLPIIREIAGAINDQFFSIDITGELFNPIVAIVPLPFLSPQDN